MLHNDWYEHVFIMIAIQVFYTALDLRAPLCFPSVWKIRLVQLA